MYDSPIKLLLTTSDGMALGRLAKTQSVTRSEMARACVRHCLALAEAGHTIPAESTPNETELQYQHIKKMNDSGSLAYYTIMAENTRSVVNSMCSQGRILQIKYLGPRAGYAVANAPILNNIVPILRLRYTLTQKPNVYVTLTRVTESAPNPPEVGTRPIEGNDATKIINYILNNTYATVNQLTSVLQAGNNWHKDKNLTLSLLRDLIFSHTVINVSLPGIPVEAFARHPEYVEPYPLA